MGLFNIFNFNIDYFHKFVESMKSSTVKAALNAFFSNLKIYLNCASSLTDLSLFIHTCKCYAYIKRVYYYLKNFLWLSICVYLTTCDRLSCPFDHQCIVFHTGVPPEVPKKDLLHFEKCILRYFGVSNYMSSIFTLKINENRKFLFSNCRDFLKNKNEAT